MLNIIAVVIIGLSEPHSLAFILNAQENSDMHANF
uniref:Uncharacterized protein n=1 Tax=Arundo donax TaxID=35708 RepID=A0A0A8Z2I4_ARUDO